MQSLNPPVATPMSTQILSLREIFHVFSACASFSPPRDTYGQDFSFKEITSSGKILRSARVSAWPLTSTSPAIMEACARVRLGKNPRSTSAISKRSFLFGMVGLVCVSFRRVKGFGQQGRAFFL